MSLRDSRWWDRELEGGLPDSRLSGTNRDNKTIIYARRLWEKVFCASCGCPGGAVPKDTVTHVFFMCTKCSVTYGGTPPGTIEVRPPIDGYKPPE